MTKNINRRQMLAGAGAVTACAVLGTGRRASAATPKHVIHEIRIISHEPQYYCGWPTLTRRKNGELLLAYSGGREGHVCPFGCVEMMRSHDEGKTWLWPCVLMDTEIDDRDAGVLETAKGTLLVTTFTSLYYEEYLANAEKIAPGQPNAWPAERLNRWRLADNRLNKTDRNALLGSWMIRSTNGGRTWSQPYDSIVSTPHGPMQLSDGRLLYAGKKMYRGESNGVCESTDDGQTWRWLAEIPTRPGDTPDNYHELYAVETADKRILAHIRNHNKNNFAEILQCESSDGGASWTTPHDIGVWGLPSHLLRLRDGRLVMIYGYRRKPFGNQARISGDHGRSWSEPIAISDDGMGEDLGYPSTVELSDGTLLSVWYEQMKDTSKAVLRQARWSLKAK
jgi:sialidase-1